MKCGRILSPGRSFASLGMVLVSAGCAIKPVPDDVTGVSTYAIARQIRCETRAAARERVVTYIKNLAEGSQYIAGDPQAQQLLARYGDGGEDISSFRPGMFTGPLEVERRNYLTMIYTTAIAYSFDLTGDETNNIGSTVNLVGPWANKLGLGITGNANRERQNERLFTLTDTLGDLLMNLNAKQFGVPYCGKPQIVAENYVYPVAGRIGVDESLKTFLELNVFANIAASDGSKSSNAALAAPTFTDKLTFTTTFDLTGNPQVTFTPVGSGFQVGDASLTGLVRRTDTHKVYVALALEPPGAVSSTALHTYLFPSNQARAAGGGPRKPTTVIGSSVTARVRTAAEDIAVSALDQIKNREVQFILSR